MALSHVCGFGAKTRFFDFVCVASLQDLYKHTFFNFFHETHVLVSCRVYIGTFDQRSAQRPPGSCLTSPCCRDFILFRIFAAQILVPLYVSLTRRHFGAFFGGQKISAYIYNLTFLAFFFSAFWGPKKHQSIYNSHTRCRRAAAKKGSVRGAHLTVL